jgi:CDGSH-type Zn-finger protein
VNTVHVRENGPLAFRAELVVEGKAAGFRATLCRCGTSKNKPWCDASHVAAGFKSSGEPATQSSEPLARRNGLLAVTPTKNGPLEVTGSLEICSGTGRTILRTQQTWLCRCGGSSNKPYCDGTHKKIGFTG